MSSSAKDPEFLLAHAGYVRALAQRLVFDEHMARDVEQETWLAALQHAPSDPRSPRAWLATLVRNFALKAWRGRGRREDRERASGRAEGAVPTPDEILERESARREVVLAVLALDEPWRSALILRYFDELAPGEVARRLGVPLETARTRIKRGLELLRARLQREHGSGRGAWALALVHSMRLEPHSYGAATIAVAKSLIQGVLIVSAAQKIVLGAAAVALLAASLWIVDRRGAVEAPPPSASPREWPTEAPELAAEIEETREASLPERSEAATVETIPPVQATVESRFGSLLLHLVWGEDRTPAAFVGLLLYQHAAEDFYQDTLLVETDATGSVLVDPILAGELSVHFDRGGSGSVRVTAGERTETTLELAAGFDIEGHVYDADGRAVAGAEIYLYGSLGHGYEGHVVGLSGEDGSYFVRSVEPGGIAYVSARAPMRAPTLQRLLVSVAGVRVKADLVFLDAGGAIEGRVLAPDGTPCAGAAVLVGRFAFAGGVVLPDGAEGQNPAPERVFADANGRFRLAGVAEGTHPIEARSARYAPWKGEVTVVAGHTTPFDISLATGVVLEGLVRDETGAPVADAQVTAAGSYGFASTFRQTRADGSFSMDGLPQGEFEVAVDAGDRGTAKTTLFGDHTVVSRWDPVLGRGLVLRGRIEAPGKELARWWLEVTEQDATSLFRQEATTDAEGGFEVIGCPDTALRVELQAPRTSGIWPAAVVENARAGRGELVIRVDPTLVPSIHIRGHVVDADGVPLGGVQVLPWLAGFNRSPILGSEAETGLFELGPYPPGEWLVRFKASGCADLATERRLLGPGETWDLGDVIMQRGGRVVVTVRCEEGVEARARFLVLADESGVTERLQRDGEAASSDALAPGRYRLTSGAEDAALTVQELEVRPDQDTRVEVVLRRGSEVEVRIVGADELPLDHAVSFELFDERGSLQAAELRPEYGPIEWKGRLAPGSYRFTARDGEGRTGSLDLEVGAADTAVVEATLRLR